MLDAVAEMDEVNEIPLVVNDNEIDRTVETTISEEEAKKIAEEAAAELGFEVESVNATLFRWSDEFIRDWVPADKERVWVWNVTLIYRSENITEGTFWVDAETGEIIMN